MGSFYGNIIDLSAEIIQNSPEIQAPSVNMNETVVLENRTAQGNLLRCIEKEIIRREGTSISLLIFSSQ